MERRVQDASHARPEWLAVAFWAFFLLSTTIRRAAPGLPGPAVIVFWLGSLAAAGYLLLRFRRRPEPVGLWLLVIPITAGILAIGRWEPGDTVNQAANVISILVAAVLPIGLSATAARRAMALILGLSLVLGVFVSSMVADNERAFIRWLYDGRLTGLLGAANVVGECGTLLGVFALVQLRGAPRVAYFALAGFAIVASSSQTSAIALMAAVVALIAVTHRLARVILAAAGGLVVLGVLAWLLFWGESFRNFVGSVTFSGRRHIWDWVFAQHIPLLGIGQSQMAERFQKAHIRGATGVSSTHDVLIDGFMRDGVVGVAAVAAVLLLLLGWIVARRAPLGLVAYVPFVLIGLFEVTPAHVPWLALYFTAIRLCVAVPLAASETTSESGTSPGLVPPVPLGASARAWAQRFAARSRHRDTADPARHHLLRRLASRAVRQPRHLPESDDTIIPGQPMAGPASSEPSVR